MQSSTANVDEATEILRAQYVDHTPVVSGSPENFEFGVSSTELSTPAGVLNVDHVRHSMQVEALCEPITRPTVLAPFRGHIALAQGRATRDVGPMRLPTWGAFRSTWDDFDEVVGSVDLDGLQRVGADTFGVDPSSVVFTDMAPISEDRVRYFVGVLRFLDRVVLGNDQVVVSPLAVSEAFRHLATAMLLTFPNTGLASSPRASGGYVEPAVLRRAVAYIDEHAGEYVGVADIAEAVRVGVRHLESVFRRHRGRTPMEELRQVRIVRAHADLQDADPTRGDTVAAIAARWGFTNAGRFSVEYRQVYGRSPGQTLRQ